MSTEIWIRNSYWWGIPAWNVEVHQCSWLLTAGHPYNDYKHHSYYCEMPSDLADNWRQVRREWRKQEVHGWPTHRPADCWDFKALNIIIILLKVKDNSAHHYIDRWYLVLIGSPGPCLPIWSRISFRIHNSYMVRCIATHWKCQKWITTISKYLKYFSII